MSLLVSLNNEKAMETKNFLRKKFAYREDYWIKKKSSSFHLSKLLYNVIF